jgi:hypothetical protein
VSSNDVFPSSLPTVIIIIISIRNIGYLQVPSIVSGNRS